MIQNKLRNRIRHGAYKLVELGFESLLDVGKMWLRGRVNWGRVQADNVSCTVIKRRASYFIFFSKSLLFIERGYKDVQKGEICEKD